MFKPFTRSSFSSSTPLEEETLVSSPTPEVEEEPQVVQPPVVQPPAVQPPAVQPPVVQPPAVQPPVVQPPVVQPPVVQPPVVQPPVVQPPRTEEGEMLQKTLTLVSEAKKVLEVEKTKERILGSTEERIEELKKLQGEARAVVLSNRAKKKRAQDTLSVLSEFDPYAEEEEEEAPSPTEEEDKLPY